MSGNVAGPTHASRHATGGGDPIAPGDIGAASTADLAGITPASIGAVRVVNFGSSASTSRGGAGGVVLWIGAAGVTPTNWVNGDLIWNTP